jgi:acetyl-CoA hydrolase
MFLRELRYGFYTTDKPNNKLDVAMIEASTITKDGQVVLGPAVGATPEIVQMSEKVGHKTQTMLQTGRKTK